MPWRGKQSLYRSARRRGTGRPPGLDRGFIGRYRLWRAAVPCSRGTNKGPRFGACLGAANKACIDQRGAEGPDALQVLIEASLAVIDLEGCSPLQPWNQ